MQLNPSGLELPKTYPYALPCLRQLDELCLNQPVTFFVGENGSCKSTLLEGIAVAAGYNAEGGSRNFRFETRASHSSLDEHLRLVRGVIRPKDGFFLRAESFFNAGTYIEDVDATRFYGGQSLHEQSHGESFMALLLHRFSGNGLYILDEPEAALSPTRQLAMLFQMKKLIAKHSQFIIATHSPILMAYPGAAIYKFGSSSICQVEWEETEHYVITRHMLENRAGVFEKLFTDE